ncbi:MAG: tRNA (adenosine(37)-N6)-dimethylallyltransferase MiaA [Actinobacteria bacterium]|nr:tRNA (adenosine(37)-N6)-dimethylallyltransferase MiaA [Actinomycetota bacterium]MCL6087514.1 tRNA (adenosine(37)-N6)-dimethylallyltransferase MiaA [Actinomycetota bacterium]
MTKSNFIKDITVYINENNTDISLLKEKLTSEKYLIIVCGPTGVGKSKAALILARIFNTDLISVDSMQSYIGMNIGTDKQDFTEYDIKQFMINICSPNHFLTSVEYRDMARNIIGKEFFDKGRIPVLAGGSGLHIRAIVDELMEAPEGDYDLRKKIKSGIENAGLQYYYKKLQSIDYEYAKKIKPTDERRIIRAIEVFELSGKKYSEFQNKWHDRKAVYNCIFIGLSMDRKKLYEKLESRVDDMMDKGLEDEVRQLVKNGYKDCFSLQQAIGYKELIKYFEGQYTLEEAVSEIKKNTRHLVKKQLTWFKADSRINWITVNNYDSIYSLMMEILNIIRQQVTEI